MKRVIYGADIFERQRIGGISRYFLEIARHMSANNLCEVEFESIFHINKELSKFKSHSGIYLPFSPARLHLNNLIVNTNSWHGRTIAKKKHFDIRHETFFRLRPRAATAKRLVVTVYDLIREKFSPNLDLMNQRQRVITQADAIICISNSTAKDLLDIYGVNQDIMSVVPLAVNHDIFTLPKIRIPLKTPYQLMYVGAREGYKSFITLVEAFQTCTELQENFRVLVIGRKFERHEVQLLKSYGVAHCFRVQQCNDNDLSKHLQNSLALVVTSQYEGFGLPVLEAMASGCLVVTSRNGSLGEVSGGFDIPFEFGNPVSLSESIQRAYALYIRNPDIGLDLKKHARQFDWGKTSRQTNAVYDSL